MCGIFGIVLGTGHNWTPGQLQRAVARLWRLSESRGREAAGLALLRNDSIQILKAPVAASALIRRGDHRRVLKTAQADLGSSRPVALIGHSRLVTDGREDVDENNQPIVSGRVVGVHNGIVVNHEALFAHHRELVRRAQVDSEVIFSLLEARLAESSAVADAACDTMARIEGTASIGALFADRGALLLATNNGSLYRSRVGRAFFFGSEAYILNCFLRGVRRQAGQAAMAIRQLRPGQGLHLDVATLSGEVFALDMQAPEPRRASALEARRRVVRLSTVQGRRLPPAEPSRPTIVNLSSLKTRFPDFEGQRSVLRRCTCCILPETMPFIRFDAQGVCNFCRRFEAVRCQGLQSLERRVAALRCHDGRPDCIVSISGGRDSSYTLHYVKTVLKLNPVALTYDWGMVTDLARRNIARLCGRLGVEHILVSADIRRKRAFIRRNVQAWLRRPRLGMVPLFMAGDKAYFRVARQVSRRLGVGLVIMGENPLERTDFKTGFAGVKPAAAALRHVYSLPLASKLRLGLYYGQEYLKNSHYWNASVADTAMAFAWYYLLKRDFLNLFDYIPWNEGEIVNTLKRTYDWETAVDTSSTWRIGDGTAAFYNYIYLTAAGFCENDTFRSNQIRQGLLTRQEALKLVAADNRPRFDSIQWYLNTIGLDRPMDEVISVIQNMPKRYGPAAGQGSLNA